MAITFCLDMSGEIDYIAFSSTRERHVTQAAPIYKTVLSALMLLFTAPLFGTNVPFITGDPAISSVRLPPYAMAMFASVGIEFLDVSAFEKVLEEHRYFGEDVSQDSYKHFVRAVALFGGDSIFEGVSQRKILRILSPMRQELDAESRPPLIINVGPLNTGVGLALHQIDWPAGGHLIYVLGPSELLSVLSSPGFRINPNVQVSVLLVPDARPGKFQREAIVSDLLIKAAHQRLLTVHAFEGDRRTLGQLSHFTTALSVKRRFNVHPLVEIVTAHGFFYADPQAEPCLAGTLLQQNMSRLLVNDAAVVFRCSEDYAETKTPMSEHIVNAAALTQSVELGYREFAFGKISVTLQKRAKRLLARVYVEAFTDKVRLATGNTEKFEGIRRNGEKIALTKAPSISNQHHNQEIFDASYTEFDVNFSEELSFTIDVGIDRGRRELAISLSLPSDPSPRVSAFIGDAPTIISTQARAAIEQEINAIANTLVSEAKAADFINTFNIPLSDDRAALYHAYQGYCQKQNIPALSMDQALPLLRGFFSVRRMRKDYEGQNADLFSDRDSSLCSRAF